LIYHIFPYINSMLAGNRFGEEKLHIVQICLSCLRHCLGFKNHQTTTKALYLLGLMVRCLGV